MAYTIVGSSVTLMEDDVMITSDWEQGYPEGTLVASGLLKKGVTVRVEKGILSYAKNSPVRLRKEIGKNYILRTAILGRPTAVFANSPSANGLAVKFGPGREKVIGGARRRRHATRRHATRRRRSTRRH